MNEPLPPRNFWERNANRMINWGCVILILGFLFLLLVPTETYTIAAAHRMESSRHLKSIGIALHDYHDFYGQLPPAYVTDKNGEPLYSWRVLLLPFIEERKLYDKFDLEKPWWSDHNRALIHQMPEIYASPFHSSSAKGKTPYCAIVDVHDERTTIRPTTGRPFKEITDGMSNTAVAIDDPMRLVEWTKPDDIDPLELLALTPISDNDMYGIHVLMADGVVLFIGEHNRNELIGMIYCDDDRTRE